jgi:hypothetical protein
VLEKILNSTGWARMAGTERKHYATEEWVDFVNGALSLERMQTMQQHLAADCRRCSKVVELWQHVAEAAKRESEYEAPESAVRHVRNAFIIAQPRKDKRSFEIPRLVFDSLWRPAAVGVRSTPSIPRQVIYRAGEIVIEMQLEPVPNSERINIAGQISDTARQDEGLAETPVVVSGSEGRVAETSTNRFGEFQLGFVPERNLRISFGVVNGRDLSIPLEGTGVAIFYRN